MLRDSQLSDVLGDFARTMLTDFPIQAILDHLVKRIVEILPVTAAGVTLISPGVNPRYVAASDRAALRFEALQTELDAGPCVAAYTGGAAVGVPDLRLDDRFPIFAQRAIDAGLVAVFAFPLRHGDVQLGALDLYRDTAGALTSDTMDAAQTLADVAAAYLLNAQARADLRDSSDESRELALHDSLTGLPNRVLFLERLDHAVRRGKRSEKMVAVLFADLDRFKIVNDLYGHGAGDELLIAVAARLTAALRLGDTLARLSGDEFVVLCEDLDDKAEADTIAARMVAALSTPFKLSMATIEMSASVGIAFAGRGDRLSSQLLGDADTAMYQAKRKGGDRHQLIDLREQELASRHLSLEQDLHGAAGRGELRVEYQPIIETVHGGIVGFEALLRWDHPTIGAVPPALAVPLAEKSGLIAEIGAWVLQQACEARHLWRSERQGVELTVAVNISANQLMARHFADTVATVLDSSGTNPRLLTLEVTESAFVQDNERALIVLGELRDLGVQLALDDFGTGYSSLTHLRRFPIDIIKIDRTFVAELEHDRASHAIVVAVTDLAHRLGMTVVAEGVETSEQHSQLRDLGCDLCQGFVFARPMPTAAVAGLLAAEEPAPAHSTVSSYGRAPVRGSIRGDRRSP